MKPKTHFSVCFSFRFHPYVLPHHATQVQWPALHAWGDLLGRLEQIRVRLRKDQLLGAHLRKTWVTLKPLPTEHSAILEPQNPSIHVSALRKPTRLKNLYALKLWYVRLADFPFRVRNIYTDKTRRLQRCGHFPIDLKPAFWGQVSPDFKPYLSEGSSSLFLSCLSMNLPTRTWSVLSWKKVCRNAAESGV